MCFVGSCEVHQMKNLKSNKGGTNRTTGCNCKQTTAFMITTPYSLYVCPEGQNVTLTCKLSGPLSAQHDLLYKIWYFSSNGDQSCSEKQHIRNVTERDLHHEPGKHHGTHSNVTERYFHGEQANHHGLETTSDHHGTFHIIMMNLTLQDSGNYCCYVVETKKEHGKQYTKQVAHGFMELRIQKAREAFPNCTVHPGASKQKENITAAALATGACIVGILCLPLILILIYKQRQAVNSRPDLRKRISMNFEFEKPKFGLLGKAKKKLATCKVEKEVNGELKPCSFKTSETSAMKSFNLRRHVKDNHPENYAALVTKKDQEDEAKQKADAAKRHSSGSLKTPGEKIFLRSFV
ncbi:Platelet receptor Gi24 [Chelonia mydas]|uniref:Platelet receptor Gi24 n=1 Tax=Chelonia mydas TaxID=8469 RepID=M7BTR3_CHEMY|nr:Platelet receptor Gi24 [Chelonia mydas]